ncbi:hypothetical protein MRB53_037617 [Persea americana]|nr:hypothetical protein MRB53_037617 [Persea americana]
MLLLLLRLCAETEHSRVIIKASANMRDGAEHHRLVVAWPARFCDIDLAHPASCILHPHLLLFSHSDCRSLDFRHRRLDPSSWPAHRSILRLCLNNTESTSPLAPLDGSATASMPTMSRRRDRLMARLARDRRLDTTMTIRPSLATRTACLSKLCDLCTFETWTSTKTTSQQRSQRQA